MKKIDASKMKGAQLLTVDKAECDRIAAHLFPKGMNAPCKVLPFRDFADFDPTQLRIVLQLHGRYGLPTWELLDFICDEIYGRETIEIGAGQGDLAFHLGIRATDSYVQADNRDTNSFYKALGVPHTLPPKYVEKLEARAAIAKYEPNCVVASWVTQRLKLGTHVVADKVLATHGLSSQAFEHGVDEAFVVSHVAKYIHIGNENSHGEKDILKLPHRTVRLPGMISRGIEPSKNIIYIWENR